jgi:hypothetical protein
MKLIESSLRAGFYMYKLYITMIASFVLLPTVSASDPSFPAFTPINLYTVSDRNDTAMTLHAVARCLPIRADEFFELSMFPPMPRYVARCYLAVYSDTLANSDGITVVTVRV